jgi:hypothetical protein
MHGIALLVGARLQADLSRFAADAELIVLPAGGNARHIQPTDFEQAELLIAAAVRATRRELDGVGLRVELAA